MSVSIDEMIKQGLTLPEIQQELRRQVAMRDEAQLKDQKIIKARTDAIAAIKKYFLALDVPVDQVDEDTLATVFVEFESNIKTTMNALHDIKDYFKKISKPKEVESKRGQKEDLETALATLRLFADNL